MIDHKHVWAYFEMDDKMAAEVGVRFMGVCVDKKVFLCSEKSYLHTLPPGYRRSEISTESGAKKENPSFAYVFDLKKLREQLGEDADLEPYIEKAKETKKATEPSASPAPTEPAEPEEEDWRDNIPTED